MAFFIIVRMKAQRSPHIYRLIFAQNMRQVRRLKDLSQEELSFMAGVSKTYISEVEKGSRSISIDLMGQIADALEIPLSQLLIQDLTKISPANP